VLSRYLVVTPDAITLDRSATGKPSLTREPRDRSSITFNLSHAHSRTLIAVSQAQEIGVDLEYVCSEIEVVKLSKRYFTRSEHTAIMQAPEEQRAMRFFRY
jgi:4'-phosphopantetheinyl transferase